MRFVFKMIVFPFWLLTAFLALMLKWTLNLSAFVLALPMLYIFGCGLYTLYCREWLQFLILLVARRLKIRVQGKDKNKYFAHTLNNTCVAPPRMLIAFLENNLQADGRVLIPEALRMYMGGKVELVPVK